MSDNNFSQQPQASYWAPPSGGQPLLLTGDQRPPDVPPDPGRRQVPTGRLIAVFVVLLVVTGVGAALLGYRQGESAGTAAVQQQVRDADSRADARAQERDAALAERDAARSERDEAVSDLSAIEREDAVQQAREAELPNLAAAADRYFGGSIWVTGSSDYLEITILEDEAGDLGPKLASLLDELGFSPAVLERMSRTRALDGTQTAEGENCNVSWTYHPDDGLQLVFEATQTG